MRYLLTLTWMTLTGSLLAAAPFQGDFTSDQPGDYLRAGFAKAQIQLQANGAMRTMVIDNTSVVFHDVPVQPDVKYTLSIVGAFSGDVESIEDNPRFEIFTQSGQTSAVLPMRDIQFLDAAGKSVASTLQRAMPFRQKHTYTDVFHTPPQAATLRLSIASGRNIQCTLHHLKLSETPDEGAINANPTFALGPFNDSGWKNISRGGHLLTHEGKTVFDTQYGSRGRSFPVKQPGTYALSAKATPNGFNSSVHVDVTDAQGKALLRVSTRRYGPPSYFVLPEGAASASFLVYSCLLEEIKLVRVGDENAIKTLK